MRPRTLLPVVVVAVALVVTSCGSDGKPTASSSSSRAPTSTSGSASSTVAAGDDDAAAKTAYLGYWQMFDRVTNPPNPLDPTIAQFSIDPARANLLDIVNTAQAAGQHFVRPAAAVDRHTVAIDSIGGGAATFTDCYVDDGIVVDSSGVALNDKVVTKLLKGRLVVDAGTWKVAQYDQTERWDGVAGCASR